MKANSILLIATSLAFFSCSSGNSAQGSAAATDSLSVIAPAYDSTLAKGRVSDSVICRNAGSQNYALYLPSYYSPSRQFPCIYFFDAHARGAMPVSAYKSLAEKYGFVLVGSNVSKNGTPWPTTNEWVKTLMQDTRSRVNIDPKRIYTAGFSGGSRVAASIAIKDGGVAGVIGCAAGFPAVDDGVQNRFSYFGMAGDYDFNFTEMQQLDDALEHNGFAHQLLTSGGIHGWAPAADFETGMLWMQVNAMKEQLQPKNDTLIAALKNDYERRIAAAKSAGDLIKEQELLDGAARMLSGLTDVAAYKKQSAELVASDGYKKVTTIQAQVQGTEMNQQQELARQFTTQDEKWWAAKIAELNKDVHTAKNLQESQMYRRLLNYLGLVGYMSVSHALKGGDLPNAGSYLKVFKMADPENPDCGYLTAVYYMQKGNTPQAISSLSTAAALGYSEVATLLTDPAFSSIQSDPAFINVLAKVRANNTPKE